MHTRQDLRPGGRTEGERADRFRAALESAKRKERAGGEGKRPTNGARAERRAVPERERRSELDSSGDESKAKIAWSGDGASAAAALLQAFRGSARDQGDEPASVRGATTRVAAVVEAEQRSLSEGGSEPLAIEGVQVGRAGETVRVHATLSEGAHRGVELRAVTRDGKVEVELRAQDATAADRLRAELGSLRETLAEQGLERVDVRVVEAGASSGAGTNGGGSEQRARDERTTRARDALGAETSHVEGRTSSDEERAERATAPTGGAPRTQGDRPRRDRWNLL